MLRPIKEWPMKKEFAATPLEEMRKDLIAASVMSGRREKFEIPSRVRTASKLVRIYAYVQLAAAKWLRRWGIPLAVVRTEVNGKVVFTAPSREYLESAEAILINMS